MAKTWTPRKDYPHIKLPVVVEVTKDHWDSAVKEIELAKSEDPRGWCANGHCLMHQALRPYLGDNLEQLQVESEGFAIGYSYNHEVCAISTKAVKLIALFDDRNAKLYEKLPIKVRIKPRP